LAEGLNLRQLEIHSLRNRKLAAVILSLTAVAALELVFVPVDGVLASPPNIPLTTCLPSQPSNSSLPRCTLTADYYRGAGSLTYCFLGEGALYLKGVYYPLTQPGASPARQIGSLFCPAMRR
jgi:hypothetical protein